MEGDAASETETTGFHGEQAAPLSCVAASLRKIHERFLKIRGTPREIALGFSLGIFIGMTPFLGVHMAIAVFLAALLKWNKLAAGIGVWISNPFTAPFVYGLTYYVGSKIMNRDPSFLHMSHFDGNALVSLVKMGPDILGTLLVGGIAVGLPIAAAGYFLAFGAIVEYRKTLRLKIAKGTRSIKDKLHLPPHPPVRQMRKRRKKNRRL
jgi:uncharacterized protein (DUF2062 family)